MPYRLPGANARQTVFYHELKKKGIVAVRSGGPVGLTSMLQLAATASRKAVATDSRLYILCVFLYSRGEHPICRWNAAEKCSMEE